MKISEYACDDCGYAYRGCGGLGVLESGAGRQTVSCAACRALRDVDLPVNLRTARNRQKRPIESILASLAFGCPVDPSHAVRPWTDGEAGWTVPDAMVSVCPACEGPIRAIGTVMLLD